MSDSDAICFDAGFGYGAGGVLGTKVVMEVQAREVPSMVYDGQISYKVLFKRVASRPERLCGVGFGSSNQHQTLTLSKQFRQASSGSIRILISFEQSDHLFN